MSFDFLHVALALVVAVGGWYLRRKGLSPTPTPGGPELPDFLPSNPLINELLKTIFQKLLRSEPLLAGEAAMAQVYKASFAAHAPGIERLLDKLAPKPTTPPAGP